MGLVGCQEGARIMHWQCVLSSMVMLCSLFVGSQCSAFNDFFYPSWALDHVMYEGELLKLKLDNTSGIFLFFFSSHFLCFYLCFCCFIPSTIDISVFACAGFASKSTYIFGKANVQIKLVPGDSAGTVTAFYVIAICHTFNQIATHFLGSWLLWSWNDWIYTWLCRCIPKAISMTNLTLNFWGTLLASRTLCRRMFTQRELATESSVCSYGSTQLQTFIPTPSSGIATKLCKSIYLLIIIHYCDA